MSATQELLNRFARNQVSATHPDTAEAARAQQGVDGVLGELKQGFQLLGAIDELLGCRVSHGRAPYG